jgi:hypothetical protein
MGILFIIQSHLFLSEVMLNRIPSRLYQTYGVSYNGKTDLFFINPQHTKVNTHAYVEHLHEILPHCQDLCSREDVIFMQDNAPSHGAKITKEFLSVNCQEFV